MSALDDQVRETVGRVLDSLRGQIETDFQETATRLAAEAAESAKAAVRQDADREIADIRESAARAADEQRARLTADIEDLQRRLDEMRDDMQRRIDDAQRQSDERQQQIDERQLQLDAAGRDTDAARQEAESARQQAEAAREEAETAMRDLESARRELDATREDVEAALRDIEDTRRDSDAVREELRQLNEALRRKDVQASQATRLPEAVRALDEAGSFGELLDRLARSAGREAGRAAVFLVKGERLRDWRTVGFDIASEQPRLDISLSDSGPMVEAVRSGEGVRRHRSEELPEFARNGEARDAAAWPLWVGDSVVAVLYADGPAADKPDEPYWPAFLEVLARHAGRVLEGLTVRQAAGLTTGRPARASAVGHQSSGSFQ